MIIELMPDQVPLFWDMVKEGMFISHSTDDIYKQDFSNDILTKIILGEMQLWLSYYLIGEEKHISSICITVLLEDKFADENSLYIHTFYPIEEPSLKMLRELYIGLSKYALANECKTIVFESMDDRVNEISSMLGFNCVSRKYVSIVKNN